MSEILSQEDREKAFNILVNRGEMEALKTMIEKFNTFVMCPSASAYVRLDTALKVYQAANKAQKREDFYNVNKREKR